MKTMEIYYDNLNIVAQREFDKIFGPPEDFNHDVAPLTIYTQEDNESEGNYDIASI